MDALYTVKGSLYDNFGLRTSFTNKLTVDFGVPVAPVVSPSSLTTTRSRINFTGSKPVNTALYMDGSRLTD